MYVPSSSVFLVLWVDYAPTFVSKIENIIFELILIF